MSDLNALTVADPAVIQHSVARLGHIGVLMGGYSSEREISLRSGKAIFAALKECGCQVDDLDIKAKNLKTIESSLRKSRIDVAFIALHGKLGEDGTIQMILEKIGIPYVGSGPEASRNALNKVVAQEIFVKNDIPVPEFWILRKKEKKELAQFLREFHSFPVVVKPANEGSSIGVTMVSDTKNLKKAVALAFRYGGEILVERYIKGRELTVGILAERPLPVIEIKPKRIFFDFTAKYQQGMTEYIVPAQIASDLGARVQAAALKAHQSLGCRHFSRVDIMIDESERPYVLEVNTIPGFTSTSLLPKAARVAGMTFTQLCLRLIELAYGKEK